MTTTVTTTGRRRRWWLRDSGQALGPELILLVVMALVVWGALSWLGRLTQTGQSIENAAQSAARIASQQPGPDTASTAATNAIAASNIDACTTTPTVDLTWRPGPTGTWRGGSVTATVTCTIANTEPFTSNGRTIAGTDTQIIDSFRSDP
ncbi:MAG: hypothetical protein AAFP84_17850 [Actinomycetota bacterium]